MKQLNHDEFKSGSVNNSIILVCSLLQSPSNLGSLCRVAEAFGVSEFYIHHENQAFLKLPRCIKTSRHSHKYLNIKVYTNIEALIEDLKKQDYFMLGLEYCDESVDLKNFKPYSKTALIIGHEKVGIENTVLEKIDKVAHIQMFGRNSSMNVSQATAIALYHCTNFS
jgi:tRNA G18 (ribose-2'-O)-methylase SpoU